MAHPVHCFITADSPSSFGLFDKWLLSRQGNKAGLMCVMENSWQIVWKGLGAGSHVHDRSLLNNGSNKQLLKLTTQFYMKTSFAQARLIPLQVCTASLLLFLSPSLSAELRHFLSELCQEGMLTTPGIATLWEFTPLKVFFFITSCPLCVFSSLFLHFVSLLPASFFCFWHHPCFFSSVQVHTDTHIMYSPSPPPLLYRSVSGTTQHQLCGEHPGLSSTNLTVSRTPQPSPARLFLCAILIPILETCHTFYMEGWLDGQHLLNSFTLIWTTDECTTILLKEYKHRAKSVGYSNWTDDGSSCSSFLILFFHPNMVSSFPDAAPGTTNTRK